MNFVDQCNGVTHVTTGALPEYTIEYREVCVHDDRLEITTHSLRDLSFAKRSLLPCKDWTSGAECDRTVTIPLNW